MSVEDPPVRHGDALFAGPGAIRERLRRIDWSHTALGPVARWPPALCAAVRLCLDSVVPMSVWAGPELNLIYNDGYPPVLGPAKDAWALGRPAREVWPEFWDRLEPELRRVTQLGESTGHENARFVLQRGAGAEEAFFTYSFTPIRERDGRILGALNVFEETTGRVRLALQREAFQSFALAAARTGLWDLDLEDRSARRSLEHDRIFGYEQLEAEWTYDRFLEHVLPEDREDVRRTVRHAAESRSEFSLECRIRRSDGEQRWIWVSGRHRVDERGRPRMAGIVEDVTERKHAEHERERLHRELGESERRAVERASELQTLLDVVPAAVWIARDPRADRIDANRFGAELLERPRGVNVSVTGPPGERPLNFRPMREGAEIAPDELPIQAAARRGVQVRDCELDLVFEDGRVRHLLGNAAPLVDAEGRVTGSVGAFVDVTPLKQVERELREASRLKDEFVAMLSHELRNPLAPIMNSLYVLDHAAPGGEQARRAQRVIARQAAQLSSLVNALLDASRLSRNLIRLQKEPLDLNEVAGRAVDDYRSLFEESSVRLSFRPSGRPIVVSADATRLAQVIGNVLHNAAKFTARGGRVEVEVAVQDGDAVARVTDDGAGIAGELLEQLSRPFTQLRQGLDRSKGGLGLGLALARSLVEMHGGRLSIHSEGPGRGTRVTAVLPLHEGRAAAPEQAGIAARAHCRRVLVIEDNPDAASSLRETLELWGHEVTVAADGPSGLECAQAFLPEVVLCDLGLPGMDGYAVARALRAMDVLQGLRLVAVSGYALAEDLERTRAAGFDRHIAKPPALDELAAALA
jgi:PAS domain S-box-containing protein